MDVRLQTIKNDIQQFAEDNKMRSDWHEPDEQDVSAQVTGRHLNNAFGSNQMGLPEDYQEYVIHLKGPKGTLKVNLADLLAIASNRFTQS